VGYSKLTLYLCLLSLSPYILHDFFSPALPSVYVLVALPHQAHTLAFDVFFGVLLYSLSDPAPMASIFFSPSAFTRDTGSLPFWKLYSVLVGVFFL